MRWFKWGDDSSLPSSQVTNPFFMRDEVSSSEAYSRWMAKTLEGCSTSGATAGGGGGGDIGSGSWHTQAAAVSIFYGPS